MVFRRLVFLLNKSATSERIFQLPRSVLINALQLLLQWSLIPADIIQSIFVDTNWYKWDRTAVPLRNNSDCTLSRSLGGKSSNTRQTQFDIYESPILASARDACVAPESESETDCVSKRRSDSKNTAQQLQQTELISSTNNENVLTLVTLIFHRRHHCAAANSGPCMSPAPQRFQSKQRALLICYRGGTNRFRSICRECVLRLFDSNIKLENLLRMPYEETSNTCNLLEFHALP